MEHPVGVSGLSWLGCLADIADVELADFQGGWIILELS